MNKFYDREGNYNLCNQELETFSYVTYSYNTLFLSVTSLPVVAL